ncbi:MAG: ABC transporter permease [Candidatus Acidiferrum sp.]
MLRTKRKSSDFNAEILEHIEQETERLRGLGLHEEEARARAHREFGNVMRAEERFYESTRWMWWDRFAQDFRFGVRVLLRNRAFAAIAVVTLALGIAVNATMFSMVSAFLLRRPPGREPERIVVVTGVSPVAGFQSDVTQISAPNYLNWAQANQVFTETAAADEFRTMSLMEQKIPETIRAAAVTPSYFSVLDVSPEIGRTFAKGDDHPGCDHVVILTHELWERRFGSDPSILYRTIRINRENYDVIGVMPASFRLMGFTPQLWMPLTLTAADQTEAARKQRSLYMFARLKPKATLEQARVEATALAKREEKVFPQIEKGWGSSVRTLQEFLIYSFGIRSALAVLMTTVGFVLLIACANVAGLLLARGAARKKELAVRISLGAGRTRILRQLLTEGLVLALIGGCLGLLLSHWGIRAVASHLSFNDAISSVQFRMDSNVLIFTLTISLGCAVLCGLVPAWSAAKTEVNTNLKTESRATSAGKSHGRLRAVMVTCEIALAMFLLTGTALLLRSISAVEAQNLGFHADGLLTAGISLDDSKYGSDVKRNELVREVIRRVAAMPGASSVAITSDLPASGAGSVSVRFRNEVVSEKSALDFVVTPDYFYASGIPLLRGRTFVETDNASAPRVIMVDQEFVRRNLANQEPLGRQILLEINGTTTDWAEIIGVVGNVKAYSEDSREEPEVYESYWQRPVPNFSVIVRTGSDPNSLVPGLRGAVSQVDPELPLSRIASMQGVIEIQKGGNPFFSNVLFSFALLALILAAIGIYGLVSYSVGQRSHEIGIRIAMGASKADILGIVLWQGAKMTLIGAAIGTLMALPLPKLFESIFYGIHANDPKLYVIVPVVIAAVSMLATYVPARRALRVDPMVSLRHE